MKQGTQAKVKVHPVSMAMVIISASIALALGQVALAGVSSGFSSGGRTTTISTPTRSISTPSSVTPKSSGFSSPARSADSYTVAKPTTSKTNSALYQAGQNSVAASVQKNIKNNQAGSALTSPKVAIATGAAGAAAGYAASKSSQPDSPHTADTATRQVTPAPAPVAPSQTSNHVYVHDRNDSGVLTNMMWFMIGRDSAPRIHETNVVYRDAPIQSSNAGTTVAAQPRQTEKDQSNEEASGLMWGLRILLWAVTAIVIYLFVSSIRSSWKAHKRSSKRNANYRL